MLELLPSLNALLNATSTVLLIAAYVAVKRRNLDLHKRLMLTAIGTSALFLVGYFTRLALTGTHRFPDVGAVKIVYLAILFSHMVLAALALPLVLRTAYLGLRSQHPKHQRIARYTWPVWLYVSVTGVVVYVMLYQVAPRLIAAR